MSGPAPSVSPIYVFVSRVVPSLYFVPTEKLYFVPGDKPVIFAELTLEATVFILPTKIKRT